MITNALTDKSRPKQSTKVFQNKSISCSICTVQTKCFSFSIFQNKSISCIIFTVQQKGISYSILTFQNKSMNRDKAEFFCVEPLPQKGGFLT